MWSAISGGRSELRKGLAQVFDVRRGHDSQVLGAPRRVGRFDEVLNHLLQMIVNIVRWRPTRTAVQYAGENILHHTVLEEQAAPVVGVFGLPPDLSVEGVSKRCEEVQEEQAK